jgi:hypothetical protein
MAPITVKLPDGNSLELEPDATGADAATAIGPGLAKAALAIRVTASSATSPGRCPTGPRSRS